MTRQWCLAQIKEVYGDFEKLLSAKYNELKAMMAADDPKVSQFAAEVRKMASWVEQTKPQL